MSISISNKEEFVDVMERLRKMPERSERITAYGAGQDPEENEDIDALGDFAEAIWGDESLKSLQDDIVNAYYQLYSIDFQRCHEGIDTFYGNFYEEIYATYRKIMFLFEEKYLS